MYYIMNTTISEFQGHRDSTSDNGQPSKQKSIIVDRISGLFMHCSYRYRYYIDLLPKYESVRGAIKLAPAFAQREI